MEFQSNLEQIKEHEEANHSTPLLGNLSRLLGVQSPSFPRPTPTSRVSLLRRRPRAPLSRFPLYLHAEVPSQAGGHGHSNDSHSHDMDYAFSSISMCERPGFYSCPQTPIHSMPPPVPRPRPTRRAQGDGAHSSSSSLAHPAVGSQLLLPDTPGHLPPPPSSAFPWLGDDGDASSGPAFSFPDPVPELFPLPKPRLGQGLLSRHPLPPRLSLDTPSSADSQPGPPSARVLGGGGGGGGGERVFSFTPPSRPLIQTSSNSINGGVANTSTTGSPGNLCNGAMPHASGGGGGGGSAQRLISSSSGALSSSNNLNSISATPTSSQPATNQQNSPNDSGISLAEDLLRGLVVQGGAGTGRANGAREQE